jgi:hypothetical protein
MLFTVVPVIYHFAAMKVQEEKQEMMNAECGRMNEKRQAL